MGPLSALLGYFFSPFGLVALAALDASLVFFLPFGVDAVVIALAARNAERFWLYPIAAAAGSVAGAALTYYIGRLIGEHGLARFVDERRLARFRECAGHRVALWTALFALLPPPFPFTPFILVCGALNAGVMEFFGGLAAARLLRFGVDSWMARRFGTHITSWMEAPSFRWIVGAFIAVALTGTVWSAWRLWRSTRRSGGARPAPRPGQPTPEAEASTT